MINLILLAFAAGNVIVLLNFILAIKREQIGLSIIQGLILTYIVFITLRFILLDYPTLTI